MPCGGCRGTESVLERARPRAQGSKGGIRSFVLR